MFRKSIVVLLFLSVLLAVAGASPCTTMECSSDSDCENKGSCWDKSENDCYYDVFGDEDPYCHSGTCWWPEVDHNPPECSEGEELDCEIWDGFECNPIDDGGGGGGNDAPTADFSYSPSSPTIDESLNFDGTSSSDSDGSINSYRWDWDDDGNYEGSGSSPTHIYSSSGSYTVTLKVKDDDGATDTYSVTISVGDLLKSSRTSYSDGVAWIGDKSIHWVYDGTEYWLDLPSSSSTSYSSGLVWIDGKSLKWVDGNGNLRSYTAPVSSYDVRYAKGVIWIGTTEGYLHYVDEFGDERIIDGS